MVYLKYFRIHPKKMNKSRLPIQYQNQNRMTFQLIQCIRINCLLLSFIVFDTKHANSPTASSLSKIHSDGWAGSGSVMSSENQATGLPGLRDCCWDISTLWDCLIKLTGTHHLTSSFSDFLYSSVPRRFTINRSYQPNRTNELYTIDFEYLKISRPTIL